jgi:hypothetical protein
LDEAKNGPASPSFPLRRRSKKEVSSVPRVFQNAKVALHMCVYRSMQYMQDLRSPGLVNQMAGGEGGVEREKKKKTDDDDRLGSRRGSLKRKEK